MAKDPDAVERDIERSRAQLAETIDSIADRVSPRRVAERGSDKLKAALASARGRASSLPALPVGPSNAGSSNPGGAADRMGALAARGRALVAAGSSAASRLPLRRDRAPLAAAAAAALLLLAMMQLRRRRR